MIHLYGIPNCDTVKKARVWLDAQGRDYTFHDYKKEGADPAKVAAWIGAAGLDTVVNRRGTTFRALSDADKAAAADSHTAVGRTDSTTSPVILTTISIHHDSRYSGKTAAWDLFLSDTHVT